MTYWDYILCPDCKEKGFVDVDCAKCDGSGTLERERQATARSRLMSAEHAAAHGGPDRGLF